MAVITASCGTMPVPSMPQPVSMANAGDTHTAQNTSTAGSQTTLSNEQTSTVTVVATQDSGTTNPESKPVEMSDPKSSPVAEESTQTAMDASTTTTAAQGQASAERDLLQSPVISKTQPSQAVLTAVATQDKEAEVIFPANDSSAVVPTANTLAMIEPPALKREPQPESREVPEFAALTANERVQNAINLLNYGNQQQAEKELADALVIEPSNRPARKLMQQLNESPDNYFGEQEYFEYVLAPNETLLDVAKKYLDDPLDFYMLAKYNDIKYPNSLASGKTLKIPGEDPQGAGDIPASVEPESVVPQSPPVEPVKSEEDIQIERAKVYFEEHRYQEAIELLKPYANKKPASKYASLRELMTQCYLNMANKLIKTGDLLQAQATLESSIEVLPKDKKLKAQLTTIRNNREAERLYRLGMQESQTGKNDQALKTFVEALQLNPEHTQAKKQITDLRLTVVEDYHKQAMVLYRKQELSRAIEIWDDVLKLDPNHELARQYRAKALELKRKIEQL